MRRVASRWSLLVSCAASLALPAACGRTSLNTFVEGEGEGARSGDGGNASTFAGASVTAGSSGTFGTGIAGISSAGMPGAGMPGGGMPAGGAASAGSAGSHDPEMTCLLSTTDCHTANEPECAGLRQKCAGALLGNSIVWATQHAVVLDVATWVDGRVAVAGYFQGLLNLDDATLPTVASDDDGFVLVFDSQRKLQFAHFFGGAGAQAAQGVAFAPGGDLVVQGVNDVKSSSVELANGAGFVARLDLQGQELWSYPVGEDETHPGQIAVDNDGAISIVGGFHEHFGFRSGGCDADGYSSYVVHLDQNGNASWLHCYRPDELTGCAAEKLVVDDEDNLIILGNGVMPGPVLTGYVQKVSSVGGPVFLETFHGSENLEAGALAVDGKMQVVIGGRFRGEMTLGDTVLKTDRKYVDDTFVAKLSRAGAWTWARSNPGDVDATSNLGALATDAADNIVAAETSYHSVQLRKLRESGSAVWTRSFATLAPTYTALATDTAGNLWFAGTFVSKLELDGNVVSSQGNESVFLMKLGR